MGGRGGDSLPGEERGEPSSREEPSRQLEGLADPRGLGVRG